MDAASIFMNTLNQMDIKQLNDTLRNLDPEKHKQTYEIVKRERDYRGATLAKKCARATVVNKCKSLILLSYKDHLLRHTSHMALQRNRISQ